MRRAFAIAGILLFVVACSEPDMAEQEASVDVDHEAAAEHGPATDNIFLFQL